MILFNGCSWTYGDELDDPILEGYPHLLADKLNLPFKNLGRNGRSNDSIFHSTMSYLLEEHPKLVIVQWTHPPRFGFLEGDEWSDHIPKSFVSHIFSYAVKDEDGNKDYKVCNIEDDLVNSSYLRMYTYMISLEHYCRLNKIPYIAYSNYTRVPKANLIPFKKDYKLITSPYITNLKNYIEPTLELNWKVFIKENILGTRDRRWNRFGHPSKLAHSLWSSYLYDRIKEKYDHLLH